MKKTVIKMIKISVIVNIALMLILYGCSERGKTSASGGYGDAVDKTAKVYKIGIAYFAPEKAVDNLMSGLFDGLKSKGFEKGKNLEVSLVHCGGEISLLPALLNELDNRKLDLIIPLSTPCLTAAIKNVRQTPIVFSYVSDPLAAGAGKSFSDHLPNVTGIGSFDPVQETVDLIKQILPASKTFGAVYNSSEMNSLKVIEAARKIFKANNLELKEISVNSTGEVYQAVEAVIMKKIDAFYAISDNTLLQCFETVAKLCDKHKVPLVSNFAELTDKGALFSVGFGWYRIGVKSGEKTAEVLNGRKTSEVPMENYLDAKIYLNYNVAKKYNIEFPESVKRLSEAAQ